MTQAISFGAYFLDSVWLYYLLSAYTPVEIAFSNSGGRKGYFPHLPPFLLAPQDKQPPPLLRVLLGNRKKTKTCVEKEVYTNLSRTIQPRSGFPPPLRMLAEGRLATCPVFSSGLSKVSLPPTYKLFPVKANNSSKAKRLER